MYTIVDDYSLAHDLINTLQFSFEYVNASVILLNYCSTSKDSDHHQSLRMSDANELQSTSAACSKKTNGYHKFEKELDASYIDLDYEISEAKGEKSSLSAEKKLDVAPALTEAEKFDTQVAL